MNLDGDILLLMALMAAVLESIVIKEELSFFFLVLWILKDTITM